MNDLLSSHWKKNREINYSVISFSNNVTLAKFLLKRVRMNFRNFHPVIWRNIFQFSTLWDVSVQQCGNYRICLPRCCSKHFVKLHNPFTKEFYSKLIWQKHLRGKEFLLFPLHTKEFYSKLIWRKNILLRVNFSFFHYFVKSI